MFFWKGTHVLIKGPTADNAHQSKNQALGSNEQSVELRNRFVLIFWECASKNLTWSHLCKCMVCAAPKRLLHTARAAEPWHIVAGVRFHWSREERRFQRERFRCRAWFILAASARAWRCAQRMERNGGFCFQTKMKERFLNQRRWTCWYSCGKKHASPVSDSQFSFMFLLFSFWKACYLCCLPHIMIWRLSLIIIIIIIYLIPQCLLSIL